MNINPKRLLEARLTMGYTQEELGIFINKSKSVISKWEAGKHQPDPESALQIADALNLPLSWFSRTYFDSDNGVYQYRSNAKATKFLQAATKGRLKWLKEMVEILEEWVEFPELNLPCTLNRIQALNLTDDDIEYYAHQLRICWGLGDSPILDLIGVAETNGVIITKELINGDNMDGVSSWFNGRPYVWLASNKINYYRSRFDLAHELGHIILHRNLTHDDCDKKRYPELERQANLFASHFLLPRKPLSLDYRAITLENLLIPKKHWGASVAALIMQYHNLGIIDDDYKSRLFKNYSYRKWRKNEPFDDKTLPEKPSLMKNTIMLLIEHGGFNKQNIVDYLGYYDKQIEPLCSLPRGFFNTKTSTRPQLRFVE